MYEIWGVHPESECEWKEAECRSYADALKTIAQLEVIDHGLGHYEVRKNGVVVTE